MKPVSTSFLNIVLVWTQIRIWYIMVCPYQTIGLLYMSLNYLSCTDCISVGYLIYDSVNHCWMKNRQLLYLSMFCFRFYLCLYILSIILLRILSALELCKVDHLHGNTSMSVFVRNPLSFLQYPPILCIHLHNASCVNRSRFQVI